MKGSFNMDDNLIMDTERSYEDKQQAAERDWIYFNFGDADGHVWSQTEIKAYEDWLMSNDPAIHGDGSYYD